MSGWVFAGVGVWVLIVVGAVAFAKAWAKEMTRQDKTVRDEGLR